MLQALAAIGFPRQYYPIAPIIVYCFGLIYVFKVFQFISKSNLAAVIALATFSSTYWGLGAFALNALRSWHLVAFFGVFYYTLQIMPTRFALKTKLLLLLSFLLAFGCGYDFYAICLAVSFSAILLNLEIRTATKFRYIALIGVICIIPIILRQIQVIGALGENFWIKDITYSLAIKIPLMSELIQIPPLNEIDAYYISQHVLRAPASPSNSISDIFITFQQMVVRITVPRWGYFSIGLWLICLIASPCFLLHKNIFFKLCYQVVLPISIGCIFGLMLFVPFSLHVYLKHEFPLVAFFLLPSKIIVIYVFLKATYQHLKCPPARWSRLILVSIFSVCIMSILIDSFLVHRNNTEHSEYPRFGWLKFYNSHLPEEVAHTVLNLPGFALPIQTNAEGYFPVERILRGEEPKQLYWIYEPADYMNDFDRLAPNCRWVDWISEIFVKRFTHTTRYTCTKGSSVATGYHHPPTLDDIESSIRTYTVIDRDDRGVGYLIMKKK